MDRILEGYAKIAFGNKDEVSARDRKAALDALGRHFGIFYAPSRRPEQPPEDPTESVREEILRRLDRISAGGITE